MKILSTVQELWSYCLFCPICQDMTRDVDVEVGPDDAFSITSFEKDNHILKLDCTFRAKKQKYKTVYLINCLDNSFTVDISEPIHSTASQDDYKRVDKASAPYFFFYLFSNCKRCNAAHTNSSDLELDLLNKRISNIGVEREGIYLLSKQVNYHILLDHNENQTVINKCTISDDNVLVDDNKFFTYSDIIDFDYSNPKKVFNKIKTLLVFS
jgi:hypothetical protein